MFVVGTVQRVHKEGSEPTAFELSWPVVMEDDNIGVVGGTVQKCANRDAAQALADELNGVLQKHANPVVPHGS